MKFISAFVLAVSLLLSACGDSASTVDQITSAMEAKSRADIQQYIDQMGSMLGESGRKTAIATLGQPKNFKITDLAVDEISQNDKGVYLIKILAAAHLNGQSKRGKSLVTMAKVDGSWQVLTATNL
jgi:outer membrane PBP1 activator LpoA protein